jgi:hypothetical protein
MEFAAESTIAEPNLSGDTANATFLRPLPLLLAYLLAGTSEAGHSSSVDFQ